MAHVSIGKTNVLSESTDQEHLLYGSGFAIGNYGIRNCTIILTTKKHRFGNAKCGKIIMQMAL